MKAAVVGALAAATLGPVGVNGQYHKNPNALELITSPRMHERKGYELENLPKSLDWRMKDDANYTTVSRNQHIPQYCGACYSFAATTSLSDRIRIARKGLGREINLAMQVVLNCDKTSFGCSGGDPQTVYQWIERQGGIPDETCQPYESTGHDTGNTCFAKDVCRVCDEQGCRAATNYPVYSLAEYGQVQGMHQMMAELQRGPIACAIATPTEFINLVGYRVYDDKTHSKDVDHIISVIGYGTDEGTPYWIVRNSWGTYWGYYGWSRVVRGKNNIQIESGCAWATPSNDGLPTWRHVDVAEEDRKAHDRQAREAKDGKHPNPAGGVDAWNLIELDVPVFEETISREPTPCRVPKLDWAAVGGERVLTPRPHETLRPDSLPKEWDWRNVSGRSYVTWNTNENLPRGKCASCWAHGLTSALADRIGVQRHGAWPQVGLSPQMLLNCNAGGSCSGGDPAHAYKFIAERGITDETCQNYQATQFTCDSQYICRNCAPGGEKGLMWPGTCVAVEQPILWFISEFGSVRGAYPMKAEIYKRGPIGCGIHATSGFRAYSGGIYSEKRDDLTLNRQVSVAGWGRDHHGSEYWLGRNSWGTYWGEDGWFRMLMHEDNLGIETDCDWAVPTKPTAVPSTLMEPYQGPAYTNVAAFSALAMSSAFVAYTLTRRRLGTVAAAEVAEEAGYYVRVS